LTWLVISPTAASCTSCHDSANARGHVVNTGGGSFGDRTQAQSFNAQETCNDCHSPGFSYGVDTVHNK
jgi:OmcA/MtrC family decaheme c-type cytochrome